MLEGIDTVDWSALEHAYGVATDVPALIRDLASPDPRTSDAACGALLVNICHQGTVYPASVAAMPLLVELLASAATPHRNGVAYLVAALLEGEEVDVRNGYVRGVLEHGRAAIPPLLPFMDDDDDAPPDMRSSLATAFARFPSHAALTVPVLAKALEVEWDDDARSAIRKALATLQGSGKPFR